MKHQLPLCFSVQVISAHNLPKPQGSGAKGEVIDPYVVLELHGVPADCAEQRTRTAAQNQDDPLFDETFEFQVGILFLHDVSERTRRYGHDPVSVFCVICLIHEITMVTFHSKAATNTKSGCKRSL